MHRLLLLLLLLPTTSAWAEQVHYGIGAAMRYGYFAGIGANGVDVSLRLGKLEVTATAMDGSEDLTSRTESSIYGIYSYASDADVEKASIHQQAAAVSIRFHPMNGSFFFGFTQGITESVGELIISSKLDNTVTISEKYKTTRTITGVSVGNHWTPGGVIIGCEWAGFYAGSNVKRENESAATGTESSDMTKARDRYENAYDDIAAKNTSIGLILSLGFILGV